MNYDIELNEFEDEFDDYVPDDVEEYCVEMCYDEGLCEFDEECLDWDCYKECIARWWK
jgi:hypothetical protein